MADQEIEHRLAGAVSGLRRGITSARGLHASLRSEAKALEDFIPMLVEGARSGITSLLKHQVHAVHSSEASVMSGGRDVCTGSIDIGEFMVWANEGSCAPPTGFQILVRYVEALALHHGLPLAQLDFCLSNGTSLVSSSDAQVNPQH